MKIAVIGLGKIGLPLAVQFASKGHEVVGVDINQETVDLINAAREPFPGEANLAEYLAELVPARGLRATTDYADAIPTADVVVVVVPLFVDTEGAPDFDSMDSATRDLAANLTKNTLIIYETTLPVGTTRTRWRPILEVESGLTEGQDFHLAFSPERVLTGRVFEDLRKYPKLVGGLGADGTKAATSFYQQVLDFDERPDLERGNGVWDLGSAEAAEMAKLAETTYRDVNIGLANQFALFAERAGIDVYAVIQAANSQPYSHIHAPGVSVGGHCIPIYPQLYLSNDPEATIVRAARNANKAMPRHAVDILQAGLGSLDGLRIVVLGVAYRPGVKETAFSGAFDLQHELVQRGARVMAHDPLFRDEELRALGFQPYQFGNQLDGAIIHTGHDAYREISAAHLPGVQLLVDGRNLLAASYIDSFAVQQLGRPTVHR
ncbi:MULTISPECIES: nucleotide sugar dehydrogenase [unclassified Nocardioides]|uniref:nucleotide sugar dehydrogenase n=1 Tax=unclassified Nocardioides TaxID=2615069 RepID=UPI000057130B|nr:MULTISPECIES: nucleotide sugar dehydrogenase [unclassified Nocardioides]ABL83709.1 UDP-glucose/GDP-mannose dehydrogenase [Nocardioides sp. JS614]